MSELQTEEEVQELNSHEVERLEEAKLKAKYPSASRPGPGGHSAFLQKRLAKGQKFFDSGDYQMAKQKMSGVNKQPPKATGPNNPYATGEEIPTPETVPARKTSIIQQSKFTPNLS